MYGVIMPIGQILAVAGLGAVLVGGIIVRSRMERKDLERDDATSKSIVDARLTFRCWLNYVQHVRVERSSRRPNVFRSPTSSASELTYKLKQQHVELFSFDSSEFTIERLLTIGDR